MEELNYNLLFRWFVGPSIWTTRSGIPRRVGKNRDRLLAGDVAAAFFDAVQAHARAAGLLSDEHFSGGRDPVGSLGQPEELPMPGRRAERAPR